MDSETFAFRGVKPGDDLWNDWKWQIKNRITGTGDLSDVLPLSEQEKADIQKCLSKFRMAVTPYYASLMNPENPNCPIRMQAVPAIAETYISDQEMLDPLSEERDSPVKNVVHRYPDRVLLLVTHTCAMYCRHCTRRRVVGEEDRFITPSELDDAVAYISQNEKIRDVLISGGDPLTMGDAALERIIARLRAIPHIEIIRIGTRVPVVLPMRITPALLRMLKKYQPIWINTHFNHPVELTAEALRACAAIIDAGIPLGNQSVLLRGINDNADIMKELLLKLVKARVRPYYLYQCDMSQGLSHFRTRVETGIQIIQSLTGTISGYALPRYVIDAPGGGGKVPINPLYVMSIDDHEVVLKNYEGKIFRYPQPQDI